MIAENEARKVPGYDKYMIDKDGHVFTTGIRPGSIKHFLNKKGYHQVYLYDSTGRKHTCMVHRLVALAFIPNPFNYQQVNHKDENKDNNSVDNLEWCTNLYNLKYGTGIKRGTETRRKISRNVMHGSKFKAVDQFTKEGKLIASFGDIRTAANTIGTSATNIVSVCRKKRPSAAGYIWKYREVAL